MRLIVYLDFILLLNVIFNGMILILTNYMIRSHTSKVRLLLGSVLATLLVPLELFYPETMITSLYGKILYSIGIILFTFGWRGILALCKTVSIFYFISFAIGGGMLGVHFLLDDMFTYSNSSLFLTTQNIYGDDIHLLFILITFPIFWLFTKRRMDEHVQAKIKYDQLYQVILTLNGQSYQTTGYLDSGNHLIDPITRRPVVLCDAPFLKQFFSVEDWGDLLKSIENDTYTSIPSILQQRVFIVPFQGVGGETSYLYTIKPDGLKIFYEGKTMETSHVLIGVQLNTLTEDQHYHCLLHPQLIHFSKELSA